MANKRWIKMFPKIKMLEGESLIDEAFANHYEHGLARGGKVYLTNKRFVFIPHKLDEALSANTVIMPLNEIQKVDSVGITLKHFFGGGLRRRLLIIHKDENHYFVINKVDEWIAKIKKSIEKID